MKLGLAQKGNACREQSRRGRYDKTERRNTKSAIQKQIEMIRDKKPKQLGAGKQTRHG